VLAWLSVCSEMQTCIWPSCCHCHSLSLASVKSRLVLSFWHRLTWVVLDKGPLNVCKCSILLLACFPLKPFNRYLNRQLPMILTTTTYYHQLVWQPLRQSHRILWAQSPSCYQTSSIKILNVIQSTGPSHRKWPRGLNHPVLIDNQTPKEKQNKHSLTLRAYVIQQIFQLLTMASANWHV